MKDDAPTLQGPLEEAPLQALSTRAKGSGSKSTTEVAAILLQPTKDMHTLEAGGEEGPMPKALWAL